MPVSVITDVITWIEMIAQIGVSTMELGVLSYLIFFGGWLDMIRLISFWLDLTVIKYIDKFYLYFEKLLAGQIFHPDVVEGVMDRVYIFVSLFVLLKLLMLFFKYLANPELVSDDKLGAQALIKRVIIGICLILFLPTIFSSAMQLQKAILNDNLFGYILLDKADLKVYEQNKHQIGRVLAFNVYQSFWNLDKSRVTSSKLQRAYDNAIKAKDPALIGGATAINEPWDNDYAYDYFPGASCIVLIYVLYLIIKYCIDVVVRMFKWFLLQMIGPLAISDYMVNGDSKDIFKNWVRTSLSVYAMLFVRIFSIWFIAFITILMQKDCTNVDNGVCQDSLLYIVGGEPDYLLRGIITLGLLALLMDLPKFFSDLFGLDLEQDASVKGIMQKAGGAAMAGIAIGGAAVGGMVQGARNLGSSAKGLAANKMQNKGKLNEQMKTNPGLKNMNENLIQKKQALKDLKANGGSKEQIKAAKSSLKDSKKELNNTKEMKEYKAANRNANLNAASQISAGLGGGMTGILTGIMSNVPGLKAVSGGYSQGQGAVNKQQQERSKTNEETQNMGSAYKKGVDMVINDLKLENEKFQFEAEAIMDGVKQQGAQQAQIDVTANINDVNTSNVAPQISATANIDTVNDVNTTITRNDSTVNNEPDLNSVADSQFTNNQDG